MRQANMFAFVRRLSLALFGCGLLGTLWAVPCAFAEGPVAVVATDAAAKTRREFLAVIDRPRVDLAPEAKLLPGDGDFLQFHFTYASEAGVRVPGLLVMKKSFASDGRRHPAVIAMHGTGGNKEGLLGLMRRLADKNLIAVAIDGRYHGERGNQNDYNAAIARAFAEGGAHPLYYDTVWDVMRLIDYLETRPDVDGRRIGLIGFSKGGIETWLASAADVRVAASVPCIGMQSFKWALEHDQWGPRVGTVNKGFNAALKSDGVEKADAAFVRRFYDRVIPGIYDKFDGPAMVCLIAPRPLLTVNGEKDDKNPIPGLQLCIESAKDAYRNQGSPEKFQAIIEPDTGHGVTPPATAAAIEWFVKWLGDGKN